MPEWLIILDRKKICEGTESQYNYDVDILGFDCALRSERVNKKF